MKKSTICKAGRLAVAAMACGAIYGIEAFADEETPAEAAPAEIAMEAEEDESEASLRDWLGFHAYADIESAYVCRGYVWDKRPYSAQYADMALKLGDYGRIDGYAWSMSALSSKGHSTSMRNAYNEVDYGIMYAYDIRIADEWTLENGIGKQWVTNPGVRHNAHSLIDWRAYQTLHNPYLTPYWKMRYFQRPYHAFWWCAGAYHTFALTESLSFTIDGFGDFGDARNFRHLFGPKPHHEESNYHGGLMALNLMLRLDWKVNEYLSFFGFAAQYCLVSQDARDAIGASTAEEATRDITYGGVGVKLDF